MKDKWLYQFEVVKTNGKSNVKNILAADYYEAENKIRAWANEESQRSIIHSLNFMNEIICWE